MPDGSYSVQQIQDYFEFIIKKHETITDKNFSIRIYVNKIKNRIVFKIKTGYKLELLRNETVEFLRDGPIIDKDKNSSNLPKSEQLHSALINCNVVQNDYLQNSEILYTFVPDKSFSQLLFVEPKALIQSKTTDYVFGYVEIWITDQNDRPFQIEDTANVTLIIQTTT